MVVRSGCPIRLCGSGPEFEVARTLIKTRLRVAMTHAQVASRWEPRSLWLLGWKVVRDFPACGASSAMPMLLDADPTASCFLPMANPRKAEATAPAVSPECGPEAGRRCFGRRRRWRTHSNWNEPIWSRVYSNSKQTQARLCNCVRNSSGVWTGSWQAKFWQT